MLIVKTDCLQHIRLYWSFPIIFEVLCYKIYLMWRCFYVKGVEAFQQALEISPKSVSAHYGLASGLLCLAKECNNLGAYRWGATVLEVNCLRVFKDLQFKLLKR